MCIGWGNEGTDTLSACVSGELKYGYTGCVYIGELKVRIYRVCVYRDTEGMDIQSACVSGELKVRIYRVPVYRGD